MTTGIPFRLPVTTTDIMLATNSWRHLDAGQGDPDSPWFGARSEICLIGLAIFDLGQEVHRGAGLGWWKLRLAGETYEHGISNIGSQR